MGQKLEPRNHLLLSGFRERFADPYSTMTGHLKPRKRAVVDAFVTPSGILPGLRALNEIFLTLERRGHKVVFGAVDDYCGRPDLDCRTGHERKEMDYYHSFTWKPDRPTLVVIGAVAIGLRLIEPFDDQERQWSTSLGRFIGQRKPNTPVRLCLWAYSTQRGTSFRREWRESRHGELSEGTEAIADELERIAPAVSAMNKSAAEKEERERRLSEARALEFERKAGLERRANRLREAREHSQRDLLELIETWTEERRVDSWFEALERRLRELPPEERKRVTPRLARARKLLGDTDILARFDLWKTPEEL